MHRRHSFLLVEKTTPIGLSTTNQLLTNQTTKWIFWMTYQFYCSFSERIYFMEVTGNPCSYFCLQSFEPALGFYYQNNSNISLTVSNKNTFNVTLQFKVKHNYQCTGFCLLEFKIYSCYWTYCSFIKYNRKMYVWNLKCKNSDLSQKIYFLFKFCLSYFL